MGTARSAPCTNLLLPDDACRLLQCSTQIQLISRTDTHTTYQIQLQPKTKFLSKTLKSVLYTTFHNFPYQLYMIELCTFIKQAFYQKICPFFIPVYSLGYHCIQTDKSNALEPAYDFVVVHGTPVGLPIETWLARKKETNVRDIQLIMFQLLYTCYVLQSGRFFHGLQKENLFLVKRTAPKLFIVVMNDTFFEFKSLYEIQVGHLPNNPPLTDDLSYIFRLCERANITVTSSIETTLNGLATALQLQTQTPFQHDNAEVMGIRDGFFKQHRNIQPFYFQPQATPKPQLSSPGSTKKKPSAAQVRYQDVLQKQEVVRKELKKLLRQ